MKNYKKTPVLRGFCNEGTVRTIRVFCPYCDQWHTHSWSYEEKGPSHRCAHCINVKSPFRVGGYYIDVFRKKDKCEGKN
jgi:hypothetical protein